ncbi:MAG TPA: MFS transporter [Proteobacteria bacterium]|nr:MFS transporter [Pseudomonadota bacterium]
MNKRPSTERAKIYLAMNNPESFISRLPWVLLLSSVFLLNFLARILFSPLLPAIETEFNIGHAAAASLFVYLSGGYFAALLGSGFLSARIPHRLILSGSAVGVGVILLLGASSQSLAYLRLTALCLGLVCGPYLPSAIATLTDTVPHQHWGKALAIHELAPNLAFTMAPVITACLLSQVSWRWVLVGPGMISILMGILFLRFGSGGQFCGQPPRFAICRSLFAVPTFWIIVLLFTLGISATMGLFNILPAYLVSHFGMSTTSANTLASLSRVLTLVTVFFGGWATDHLGPRRTLIVVLGITGMLTAALGLVPVSALVMAKTLVFLQPLLAVVFFPAGFAIIAGVAPAENRNLAVSLVVALAFLLGGGFAPYVVGICGDAGHFSWGIFLLGCLVFSGALVAPFLPRQP